RQSPALTKGKNGRPKQRLKRQRPRSRGSRKGRKRGSSGLPVGCATSAILRIEWPRLRLLAPS
ncbi:hypothetical protein BGZ75_002987, partial [Mortierella antarctica]